MNKIILLTGSIVGVAYLTEFFIAYYSGGEYEQYTFLKQVYRAVLVGWLYDVRL